MDSTGSGTVEDTKDRRLRTRFGCGAVEDEDDVGEDIGGVGSDGGGGGPKEIFRIDFFSSCAGPFLMLEKDSFGTVLADWG